MKESLSYIAQDFQQELDICHQKVNPIIKEYVLPDYKGVKKGFSRDPINFMTFAEMQMAKKAAEEQALMSGKKPQEPHEQAVRIANERFTVPEVLFRPSDIGINEAGVPEMIQQVVNKCPQPFEGPLYNNIIIAGGNTLMPGFKGRLEKELETLRPYDCPVRVFEVSNPTQAAWKGLKQFCSKKHTFDEYVVTKKEFQEEGYRVLKKFYL